MGRPELIIVANCREKTATSFSFTFLAESWMLTLRPFFSLPTSSGV